jgi:DNA-binding response OmpR family regulator
MTILIITDDAQMGKALKSFVLDLAASVYECSEGAQTLATYARHRPDWVLIDAELKDVAGFTVTRQLKSQAPQVRILFLTNYDDADLRAAAREAGACAYLIKDDLLALRRVLTAQPEEPQ